MNHGQGVSLRTYTVVYFLLLALLVLTVLAAKVDFGWVALLVAMGIATAKATLIAIYFMHLRGSSRWVLMFFLAAIYMLAMGGVLVFADYRLRY